MSNDVTLPARGTGTSTPVVATAEVSGAHRQLVGASPESSAMFDGGTVLTPKFAVIAAASSGNNAIVGAVAGKKIRVLAYNFIASGSVNAKFQSDGGGTPVDKTGLKYCVANSGLVAPYCQVGWFETAVGKSLDLNLSGATAVGGELVYVEV